MKDSGIEWIGDVPQHWNLQKIATLYKVRNQKVSDKDFPPLSVTMKGIVPQLETAAKTNDGDNRKLVRVGDFAINSRSDRRGSCGISSYDGSVSLINTVLTPKGEMNPKYYEKRMGANTSSMVPRVFKTNVGDIFTTNTINEETLAIGDVLAPGKEDGILCKAGDLEAMKWQVVKLYTMPDGQKGVKVMRIA